MKLSNRFFMERNGGMYTRTEMPRNKCMCWLPLIGWSSNNYYRWFWWLCERSRGRVFDKKSKDGTPALLFHTCL